MQNNNEQLPVYGPAEPRQLDVLQAEQTNAASIVDAIQQEKAEINTLSKTEQKRLAGHVAMLDTDEAATMQTQQDIVAEGQVRYDINRNRLKARIADNKAQREQSPADPWVPDPQTGQPIKQSELADANRTYGHTDNGKR